MSDGNKVDDNDQAKVRHYSDYQAAEMEMMDAAQVKPDELGYSGTKEELQNSVGVVKKTSGEGQTDVVDVKLGSLNRKKSMIESQMGEKEYNIMMDQMKLETANLKITDLFVDSPCKPMCACYCWLILCLMISGGAGFMQPALGGDRDYNIWLDPVQIDYDMYTLANEDIAADIAAKSGVDVQSVQTERSGNVFLLYEQIDNVGENDEGGKTYSGKGLLKLEHIKKINEIEQKFMDDERFKDFCLASTPTEEEEAAEGYVPVCSDGGLISGASILLGSSDINTVTQEEIEANLLMLMATPFWEATSAIFDKKLSVDNLAITHMQGLISTGGPLRVNDTFKYDNTSHNSGEQRDILKEFILEYKAEFAEDNTQEAIGFDAQMFSFVTFLDEILILLYMDMGFILVALLFVFCFFVYHLQSKFLSMVGISIIFLSFPFSAVIVQGLGQVSYFGTLQVIAIFLVIGIAADDIFVFIDAWKQSEHIGQEVIKGDKKKRMAYAFRRGVRAMTVTSSTTAVAFFANAFSPIMPIRAFGIFTGVLIPINFFLVVMIMPPAVIYYESVVKKKYTRMCGCCPGKGKCCCCPAKQDAESTEVEDVAEGRENSKVEVFFDTTWNDNVFKHRYVIVLFSLAWAVVTFTQVPKMGPQTEQEDFLKKKHQLQQVFDTLGNEFGVSTQAYPEVYVYWGAKDIDRTGENQWNATFIGDLQYDDSFDISEPVAQQYLYDLCDTIENYGDLVVQDEDTVVCWIRTFKTVVEQQVISSTSNDATCGTGVDAAGATCAVNVAGDGCEVADGTCTFVAAYLSNIQYMTFPVSKESFYLTLDTILASPALAMLDRTFATSFLYEDGKIKYMQISAITKVARWAPGEIRAPFVENWQAYIDTLNEDVKGKAPTLANMKQTCGAWTSIAVERAFVTSAFQGIAIAMTFSFIILMLVTRNLITSLCSIFCVVIIITSIITFMHWDGQQFGSNQSIAVVMLIGFSVDYVLHLSTDFMHSSQPTRALKMQQSFREMGVSILSGSITTFFCGFFLFFANFVFFETFAFVISLTVLMAFFFAMTTFGALMHIIGPEKDFCTIKCGGKKEVKKEAE